MFEHLQTLTLLVVYEAQAEGQLPPYLGSTIRGVIGHRLREKVCQFPGVKCHQCTIAMKCSYALHFCSPGNEGGAVNPYVIRPLVRDKVQWQEGERLMFEITLIGRTAEQAAFFIEALQADKLLRWGAVRMPFRLVQIIDPHSGSLIWNNGEAWLHHCRPEPLSVEERPARNAMLRFDSPLRLLVGRQLRLSLSFADLIQSLSRRLALLSQAYTGYKVEWNEALMLEAATEVRIVANQWRKVDFQRYSMNRPYGDKLDLPAIEGWVRYEGDLTPFTPLLAAGERLHVGKNATIGFGQYRVSYG